MMDELGKYIEAHAQDILKDLDSRGGFKCHAQLVDLKDTLKAMHLAKQLKV